MCVPPAFAAAAPGRERVGRRLDDSAGRDVVLLAEDNEFVARLVHAVLGRRGFRVVQATDGAGCERLLALHGPEVAFVMLDWHLPDTTGPELCARLRDQAPALPVLFMSGRDHGAESRGCAGAPTAFVRKPFRPAEIEAQIRALLAGALPAVAPGAAAASIRAWCAGR